MTKRILTSDFETVNYFDPANEVARRVIIEAMARKPQEGTLTQRIHRLFLSNRPGAVGSIDELVQVGPGSWIVTDGE